MHRDSDRIAELKREIDANPHSRQFYQLGELLRREGRLEEAAAVLRRGLQYWPKYVAAWVSLGRAELERRTPEGATPALEKAIELDPENPVAWRLLAEAREVAGEMERALAAMRRAASLVHGDETLLQALQRLESALAAPLPAPSEPTPLAPTEPVPHQAAVPQVELVEAAEASELEQTAAVPAPSLALSKPIAILTPAPPLSAEDALGPPPPGKLEETEGEIFGQAEGEFPEQEAEEPTEVALIPPTPAAPMQEAQREEVAFASPPAAAEVAPLEEDERLAGLPELIPAPDVATVPAAALPAPFEEMETVPLAPAAAEEPLRGDVFSLTAPPAAAAMTEDVFGAELQAASPEAVIVPLLETPQPLPSTPELMAEPLPAEEEVSRWATQARLVLPIPPPPLPEAVPPPVDLAPAPAVEVPSGEAAAEEPREELWPPVAPQAPELITPSAIASPPAPATPVASVEAARELIRAERLVEAVAVLERVVSEHPEHREARELLELVRDMLEPMPIEVPPLSRRERKIAALQRWLASLTLARERAAL